MRPLADAVARRVGNDVMKRSLAWWP